MEKESSKDEKAIRALQEVREKVTNEPGLKYDPNEGATSADELAEQIKGSDADEDQPLTKTGTQETEENKQSNEGSDADHDKQ